MLIVMVCAAVAPAASAVDFDQSPLFRQLQFNFGNPGARALGMGGAFLGRADDASAAEANPAGLLPIDRDPEITIEVRSFRLTQRLVGGGVAPNVDYVNVSSDATPRPTFASVVFPRESTGIALYYHAPFDYRQKVSLPRATVVSGGGASIVRSSTDAAIDYRTETFGFAGAWCVSGCVALKGPSVTTHRLTIGGALKFQRLSARLTSAFFATDPTTLARAVPQRLEATIGTESNDVRTSYALGVRWMSAHDTVGFGAVYKAGSTFNVLEFCTNPPQGNGACVPESYVRQSTFATPDIFGAGMSVKPLDPLTVNVDVEHITYSVLIRDFTPTFPGPGNLPAREAGYRLNDATEIHVGAEWQLQQLPVTLRAGYWHEPAHVLTYQGRVQSFDERLAALLYPGSRDLHHLSAGMGYERPTYTLHVGIDHAANQLTVALSLQMRLWTPGAPAERGLRTAE
jgi:long-chain fatty acid transport protein